MKRFKGIDNTSITVMLRDYELETDDKKKKKIRKNLLSKLSFLPQQYGKHYDWAENKDDILQAARIGLLNSLRTFKWRENDNFIYWSDRSIKKEIGREKYRWKQWIEMQEELPPIEDEPDLSPNPEEAVSDKERMEILSFLLTMLGEKERLVLEMALGIEDGKPKSIREIARKIGVSHECARVVLNKTSEKMQMMYQEYTC